MCSTNVSSDKWTKNLSVSLGGESVVDGGVVTSVDGCSQVPISVLELYHYVMVVREFALSEEDTILPTGGDHAHACSDTVELEVDVKFLSSLC